MILPLAAIAVVLLGAQASPRVQEIERVVVLPVENLSGSSGVDAAVSALVADAVARKGYTVIHGEVVERFLEGERIRYMDALPTQVAQRMLSELDARAILTAAVYTWSERPAALQGVNAALQSPRDPEFALSVRLQNHSGEVVWSGFVGLTGDDTAGVFQLGRLNSVDAVALFATASLMAPLPGRGEPPGALTPRSSRAGLRRVGGGRARTFDPSGIRRICILPLELLGGDRLGAPVVSELLANRLREVPGLSVVSQGDLREALVSLGIRSLRVASRREMEALADRLEVDLFVHGAVFGYEKAQVTGGSVGARVSIYLSAFNARPGRLLWSALGSRSSEDYMQIFKVIGITDRATLADQVVAELVADLFSGSEIRPDRKSTP